MESLTGPLKALADESRLRILWMLEERYLCVCEIQEALGLAQSTVSRHLQLLEEAGFVISEKEGQWKNYRLNPAPPPAVGGLVAVVRMSALTDLEALALREKVKTIRRENICCRKTV
jgi:ArsR family transcriptional regulator